MYKLIFYFPNICVQFFLFYLQCQKKTLFLISQFEIVKFRKGDDDKDLSVNGKCPYFRILIKRLSAN